MHSPGGWAAAPALLLALLMSAGCRSGETRADSAAGTAGAPDTVSSGTPAETPPAGREPPGVYVDRGACPFECCTYGTWRADSAVTLRDAPSLGSAEAGLVPKGTVVTGVTGEVHVRPGRFVLQRGARGYRVSRTGPPAPADSFAAGDTLGVYTYRGEGAWKVRKWGTDAELVELMLAEPGTGCESSNACDGRFLEKPQSTWWVQIRTPQGLTGWTTNVAAFAGKDACGGTVITPPSPRR